MEILREHILQYISADVNEMERILGHFRIRKVNKKENLLTEGQICRENYFVSKGILRKFFINNKGAEQTIEFAIENWWMSDLMSLDSGKASEFYIQAVENSSVLYLSREQQKVLLREHPIMEKYFRSIYQRAHAAAQVRIKLLYGFSREELYYRFRSNFPEFLERIPQYLIASYLGFTPEYLSEIRKKKIS